MPKSIRHRRRKITIDHILRTVLPVACFNDRVRINHVRIRRRQMTYYRAHHDIPIQEMANKLSNQSRCAICECSNPKILDHEHDVSQTGMYHTKSFAGRVRSMLCNRCNILEGRCKHLSIKNRVRYWAMKTGVVRNNVRLRRLKLRLSRHGYLRDHFKH